MNNLNFSYWFKLSDLESVVVDSQGRVSGMTMNRSGAFENEAFPLCDRLESMGGKAGLCGFFNLN